MCGISGIINLKNKPIKNIESKIDIMTRLLEHRGPDYSGKYINPNRSFGLSNNRLSIVSPKEKIALPFSADNINYLSFNGEIYNYPEIKKKLLKQGIKFHSNTDTEVFWNYLKLLNRGKGSFNKLNGMWTYAFYNQKEHKLFLGRDLIGERHIFYYVESDNLYFSSEVKPIIYASNKKHRFDDLSLVEAWRYNSCSNGRTLIKNIYKLEPGCCLKIFKSKMIKERNQEIELTKWINFFKKEKSEKKVFSVFKKMIRNEVFHRTPKDVNFFTTLSGGIDSTIIASSLTRKKKKIKTIYAYSSKKQFKKIDQNYSEVELSQFIAKKYNINHSLISIGDSNKIIKRSILIAKNCFEGCVDPGLINFTGLSEYLKLKKIKVGLMSEGPDELLGGYFTDQEAHQIDRIYFDKKKKNRSNLKNLIKGFNLIKDKKFKIKYSPFKTRVTHYNDNDHFLELIINNFKKKTKFSSFNDVNFKFKKKYPSLSFSQIRALNYIKNSIPEMINMRKDKSMMMNSVEPRFPFLSKNIVEFFLSMPDKYRFGNGFGKFFLRKFCEKYIDKNVAWFPKKGMGDYSWNYLKNFLHKIKAEKTIKKCKLFSTNLFRKGTRNIIFGKNIHKSNIWIAFVLAQTYNHLEKINKKKS